MNTQQKEMEIINLSKEKFQWEVEGKMDLFAGLFANDGILVHATGAAETKQELIDGFNNGRINFKSIEIKEAAARVYGQAAIVNGMGDFTMIYEGSPILFDNLTFTETYVNQDEKWQLVSVHFSRKTA